MNMKWFRKLSFLLATVLVMTSLNVPVMADFPTLTVDGLVYTLFTDSGKADLSGPSNSTEEIKNPVIPRTVTRGETSFTVVEIDSGALENNTGLTGRLKIEGGSEDGDNAFMVRSGAFSGCTNIDALIIGPHTKTDGQPFADCSGLKKITNNSGAWVSIRNSSCAVDIPEIESFMRQNCGMYFKTVQELHNYLFD